MLDFGPATTELARVLQGVGDDQLDNPTPCSKARVRDLIDHVDTFAQAFTASATKTKRADDRPPPADGSNIGTDWRTRVPARLEQLAAAWRDPASWDGMSVAGPFEMPAPDVARVAIDELLVHGWDIATATGQSFAGDDELVAAATAFVHGVAEQNPAGTPGLFGPAVTVPGDAPPLDQLLGLTGRDPNWTGTDD
jgi:uncharacterized protein (TIGR03086 family)